MSYISSKAVSKEAAFFICKPLEIYFIHPFQIQVSVKKSTINGLLTCKFMLTSYNNDVIFYNMVVIVLI
jgi:hypothetical protein